MPEAVKIRFVWLKIMYAYTLIGAGGFGLGILLMPDLMIKMMGFPAQDPITLGIAGSVFCGFAVLAVLGLRSPLRFAPVLLLQLCYKLIWCSAVMIPLVIKQQFPGYAVMLAVIFMTYIIGDLIAIPFPVVFARDAGQ